VLRTGCSGPLLNGGLDAHGGTHGAV
jgi:hypothetical protein